MVVVLEIETVIDDYATDILPNEINIEESELLISINPSPCLPPIFIEINNDMIGILDSARDILLC